MASLTPKNAYIKPGMIHDEGSAGLAVGRVEDPLLKTPETNSKAELILHRSPKSI